MNFERYIEIGENSGICILKRKYVSCATPTHIAFSILSLSKIVLIDYYFNHLLKAFALENLYLKHVYTDSKYICLLSMYVNQASAFIRDVSLKAEKRERARERDREREK